MPQQNPLLFQQILFFKFSKCPISIVSKAPHFKLSIQNKKLSPAEISRTIMELAIVGILSALTKEGHEGSIFSLAISVKFAVDPVHPFLLFESHFFLISSNPFFPPCSGVIANAKSSQLPSHYFKLCFL
ncbi:hypothetical protein AHAS_Ahas14G0150400 [Arachis hypogaea]|uniref:Uncharacterized protein n=1 Tax=Arachis hypogaea TaxID=3818 RepID=A0A444ZNG8_ARAHY|nr:hypothetical protein Ahy_B04g072563 [Arachis hypogaea]